MPDSRHGIGAVVADGRIHIPGGGPIEGFGITANHARQSICKHQKRGCQETKHDQANVKYDKRINSESDHPTSPGPREPIFPACVLARIPGLHIDCLTLSFVDQKLFRGSH